MKKYIQIRNETDYPLVEVGEVYRVREELREYYGIKVTGSELHIHKEDCNLLTQEQMEEIEEQDPSKNKEKEIKVYRAYDNSYISRESAQYIIDTHGNNFEKVQEHEWEGETVYVVAQGYQMVVDIEESEKLPQ